MKNEIRNLKKNYKNGVLKEERDEHMSIFFKKMNQKETASWTKAAVTGFYAIVLLLSADLAYGVLYERELVSKSAVLWTGMGAAFGSDLLYRWISAARANKENKPS